jgi:ubiquitin-protein ligase
MSVRLRRLESDYEAVRRLAHHHPKIRVEGIGGNPPEKYQLILSVRSLRERGDQIMIAKQHRLEITLPRGYPRDAPVCRMMTPTFHPNIAPHAVCIGDHWSAAESLDLMIQRVGEMLAFQSYNVKSPLNGRAAQWVEENVDRLPIDKEEFFIDLSAVAPAKPQSPARRCSNCDSGSGSFEECGQGHLLCLNCVARCKTCGALLCLSCGTTRCAACAGPECTNCAAGARGGVICDAGHTLCRSCVATCERCSRTLCVLCDGYPCKACAAEGEVTSPSSPA